MHLWAHIAPICRATGIPKSPSSRGCCARDAGSVGLEEVELVDRVFVDGTSDDDEESKKKAARNEDERGEREDRSCRTS